MMRRLVILIFLLLFLIGTVDATIYYANESNDGRVFRSVSGGGNSWSEIRNGPGTSHQNNGSDALYGFYMTGSTTTNNFTVNHRSMVTFPTNIGSNAVISNVEIDIKNGAARGNSLGSFSLSIVDAYPTNKNSYATSDYLKTTYTKIGPDTAYSSLGGTTWTNISLTNFTFIDKTGYSTIMFMSDADANNAAPTWASGATSYYYAKSNYVTSPVPVVINITYTIPESSNWTWDFGDGTTSTDHNPVHTYTTAGTYTVNLTVTGANPVIADFTANTTTSTTAPVSIQFTDTSTFGAGATETKSKEMIITVGTSLYSAGFIATPLNGTSPLTVQFLDQSVNATSWYYEFDNFLANSTLQNPNWTFTTAGNYSVRQKINSIYGHSWENKTNYIRVLPVLQEQICTNRTGNLTLSLSSVTNNSMSWLWDASQNITALSFDGFYLTPFDNSSNTTYRNNLAASTYYKFRLYNATGYGELNCTTNATPPPAPTPLPNNPAGPASTGINAIPWWGWIAAAAVIIILASRR